MSNKIKNEIRPLYSEFQGYLSQAPKTPENEPWLAMHDEVVWEQYNDALNLLSKKTQKSYDRFKIVPKQGQGGPLLAINTFRQKVGGLISNLHGEYFSDEPPPFSGMPSTIINQTQQQTISVQLVLDIQSKIDELLPKVEDGSNEQKFLEKFKSTLSSVSNVNDAIGKCMKFADEFGVNVQEILSLWG
jgi:hypothetical protein